MQYLKTRDGVLARIADSRSVPEIWWPRSGKWVNYPELDTQHDAAPISDAEARAFMPAACGAEAGGTKRAPLRREA